jgi:hypothetical protein
MLGHNVHFCSMRPDKLLIIADEVSDEWCGAVRNVGVDVLALTPNAMLSLGSLDVPYCTVEDFFDLSDFRDQVSTVFADTKIVFEKCDSLVQEQRGISNSYSGNLLYFLLVICDLIYLEALVKKIGQRYKSIELLIDQPLEPLDQWGDLSFVELKGNPGAMGSISFPLTDGIHRKLQLLTTVLNVQTVIAPLIAKKESKRYIEGLKLYHHRVSRLRQGFASFADLIGALLAEKALRHLPMHSSWCKPISLVAQSGHEVARLRKFVHMRKLVFYPLYRLRRGIPTHISDAPEFEMISRVLEPFLAAILPIFHTRVHGLFSAYHREVVGRLNSIAKEFEALLESLKPDHLLFSTGNRDVLDTLLGVIANKKNIPVVFFQHGGVASRLINNPFQHLVENTELFHHHLILGSRMEGRLLAQDSPKSATIRVLGSIASYTSFCRERFPKRKAIFPTSPFSTVTFRNYINNGSDKIHHQISEAIIRTSVIVGVELDIKIHPIEKRRYSRYYQSLLAMYGSDKTNLILDIPAETILPRYGLVVLDFLPSTVVQSVLSMDVPVVCFLTDVGVVNDWFLKGLRGRCHFVNDSESLEDAFRDFLAGRLPSKWTQDFVDEYICPIKEGHPGEKIAEYLEQINPRPD